jgi:hypothetical protein
MVNPSTADAQVDDATIRRVIGFGKRFGWSRVLVGNVFAFRATDIRALGRAADPIGPDNAKHLRAILQEADVAVAAWGTLAKLPQGLRSQWESVCAVAQGAESTLNCLGLAADGHPRHPLMLHSYAALARWMKPQVWQT